ncbi:hypothetical protein SLNHY_3954 [Streptomyces albus]|nr:hypothetical protein SLNHY_3954 [Streptomyces albus]
MTGGSAGANPRSAVMAQHLHEGPHGARDDEDADRQQRVDGPAAPRVPEQEYGDEADCRDEGEQSQSGRPGRRRALLVHDSPSCRTRAVPAGAPRVAPAATT